MVRSFTYACRDCPCLPHDDGFEDSWVLWFQWEVPCTTEFRVEILPKMFTATVSFEGQIFLILAIKVSMNAPLYLDSFMGSLLKTVFSNLIFALWILKVPCLGWIRPPRVGHGISISSGSWSPHWAALFSGYKQHEPLDLPLSPWLWCLFLFQQCCAVLLEKLLIHRLSSWIFQELVYVFGVCVLCSISCW